MPASKYVEKSGRFKPVGGSRFEGCVKAQQAKGLSKESAEKLCAYIGRQAGKIAGSASCAEAPRTSSDGGGYRFSQTETGTFLIHDVPIMAEVPEDEKGNKRRVGKPWMVAAVKKAAKRLAEDGYMAPLHVDHHNAGGKPEPAGFVMPKAVRKMRYEGRAVWAVFADLEVQPAVFERIKTNALPYRSVEIFDWDKPEVNSLALLADEVPYFRFDVLRLGDEIEKAKKFHQTGPAMACRGFALGSAVLFSFKGGPTVTDATEKTPDLSADRTEEGAALESRAERADVDKYEYEEGKEAEKKEEEMTANLEEQSQEFFDHLFDLVRKIADKLGVDSEEEAEDVEDTAIEEVVEAPVEQHASAEEEAPAALAAMQGKINALEARERARLDTEGREKTVEKAMSVLSAWSPDDKTRENLIALVAQSRHPEKTAATFVASYQATVPQRPLGSFEEFDARMAGAPDHPEVLKFAEKGPDALSFARQASQQYDELSQRGMTTASRESFIQTQLLAESGEIVRR